MYCSRCGKEIKDDSKYCPNCGNKIDLKDNHVYESNKSSYDQRIKVDTNQYEFDIEGKKKFYFKYFLIGCIPIFGFIYLQIYNHKKDKERTKYISLSIGVSVIFALISISIFIVFFILFFNTGTKF